MNHQKMIREKLLQGSLRGYCSVRSTNLASNADNRFSTVSIRVQLSEHQFPTLRLLGDRMYLTAPNACLVEKKGANEGKGCPVRLKAQLSK